MIAEDRPGAAGARSRELTSPAASAPASETMASPSSESAPELTTLELEALLFVAERPLTRREIASLAGVDAASVDARLGDLQVDLADRGIRLLAAGDRVALATAPEAGSLISRYVGAEGVRLTPAALETLAIVAYRQPVTRAAIERIRGVDSDYVLRSLLHRRLITEQGRSDAPGRPILYGTSFEFLERFGLTSLDDLPALDAQLSARIAEAEAATAERSPGDPAELPVSVALAGLAGRHDIAALEAGGDPAADSERDPL